MIKFESSFLSFEIPTDSDNIVCEICMNDIRTMALFGLLFRVEKFQLTVQKFFACDNMQQRYCEKFNFQKNSNSKHWHSNSRKFVDILNWLFCLSVETETFLYGNSKMLLKIWKCIFFQKVLLLCFLCVYAILSTKSRQTFGICSFSFIMKKVAKYIYIPFACHHIWYSCAAVWQRCNRCFIFIFV